ncbi:hypothetical protein ABH897_004443 [Paenibacillus sp. RC73]
MKIHTENGAGGMVLYKQQRWEAPSAYVVART